LVKNQYIRKERGMTKERKVSVLVGVLYVLGTAFGIASVALMNPLSEAEHYLAEIAGNNVRYISGALAVLLMGVSLTFIPIFLFPILKRKYEKAALVCLVFRSGLEMVNYIIAALLVFALLFLAENTLGLSFDSGIVYLMGDTLKDLYGNPVLVIVFSIYAVTLYSVFYKSRLLPRWISLFGLAAIALHFAAGILVLFGLQEHFSTANLIMNFPVFLQEMVMAFYLILSGFRKEALPKV